MSSLAALRTAGALEQPKAVKSCEVCGGTGWQWLPRSWFTSDGYHRRERCSICAGTGKSDYRARAEKANRGAAPSQETA